MVQMYRAVRAGQGSRWKTSASTGLMSAVLVGMVGAGGPGGCGGRSVEDGDPSAGASCAPPASMCGSACVDLLHSPDHCGACGNVCGLGEICNGGLCNFACIGGATACGSLCVDLAHDPNNCGACGNRCEPGTVCSQGYCDLVCLGGATQCGAECADTDVDPSNCGGCGVACADSEACSGGACLPLCSAPTSLCGGACVALASDPSNCGGCGVVCAGAQVCSAGACLDRCGAGLAPCNGACVDLENDPVHCGACGVTCESGGSCAAGVCQCAPGETSCGSGCVDTGTNPAHCGGCGMACSPGQICAAGVCEGGTDAWRMLGYDDRHSGHNPMETGTPPASLAWSIGVGAYALHPAVIEGGRVFVTDEGYFDPSPLRALSLANGSDLWSHDFGEVFGVGHPSVVDGKVYVQHCNHGGDTKLWQFDAATGNADWAAPHYAQWENYWAPLVVGDSVYVNGGSYGGLYGFSRATANQLFFSDQLEQYDEWSPAHFNGLIFTFIAGNLRAHNPNTGAIQWTTAVTWNWSGWSMRTAPVFSDTMAYVIAPPSLSAINATTHAIVWSADGSFESMPAVAGGAVYALNGGSLAVRDAATGTPLWAFAGDGMLSFPPVIAGGHVYVASSSNVYAVDVTTHAQVWTDSFGGWISVASGKLVVARANGTLAVYNLTL
jgi:outer membrane protein assembly factor BamB